MNAETLLELIAQRLRESAESNRGMANAYAFQRCDNMAMGYETRAEALEDVAEVIEELLTEVNKG